MRRSLTAKAGYISMGRALASLSSLIAGALLSRYLTKEAYGTYRQLWLVYNTLYPILVLGIPTSVNYFIPQLPEEDRRAFNFQTFLMLTLGGGILSLVFFWGAPLIAARFHNPDLVPVAQLFSLIPLLTLPTRYYADLLVSLDKALIVAGLSSTLAFGRLIAVGVPVVMGYDLKGVLFGLVAFSLAQLVIVGYFIFRPFGFRLGGFQWPLLLQQIRYALPIGVAGIIGTLTKQVDKIVVSSFFLASQYAVYANGAIEVPFIGILTGSVTAVLLPEFVRMNAESRPEQLLRLWHNAIRKVALLMMPLMVFLFIYAPEFLTLLFSSKYVESTPIFRIYLLALPNRVTTFGTILLAVGLSRWIMQYSFYTLILDIGLNYLLVRSVGIMGPAMGTVGAIYFVAFLQLRKIGKVMNIPLKSIFPWGTLGKTVVIAAVAGIFAALPKIFFPAISPVVRLLFGGMLYVPLFAAGAFRWGVLRKTDLEVLSWSPKT